MLRKTSKRKKDTRKKEDDIATAGQIQYLDDLENKFLRLFDYTLFLKEGVSLSLIAYVLGTLCEYRMSYLEEKAKNKHFNNKEDEENILLLIHVAQFMLGFLKISTPIYLGENIRFTKPPLRINSKKLSLSKKDANQEIKKTSQLISELHPQLERNQYLAKIALAFTAVLLVLERSLSEEYLSPNTLMLVYFIFKFMDIAALGLRENIFSKKISIDEKFHTEKKLVLKAIPCVSDHEDEFSSKIEYCGFNLFISKCESLSKQQMLSIVTKILAKNNITFTQDSQTNSIRLKANINLDKALAKQIRKQILNEVEVIQNLQKLESQLKRIAEILKVDISLLIIETTDGKCAIQTNLKLINNFNELIKESQLADLFPKAQIKIDQNNNVIEITCSQAAANEPFNSFIKKLERKKNESIVPFGTASVTEQKTTKVVRPATNRNNSRSKKQEEIQARINEKNRERQDKKEKQEKKKKKLPREKTRIRISPKTSPTSKPSITKLSKAKPQNQPSFPQIESSERWGQNPAHSKTEIDDKKDTTETEHNIQIASDLIELHADFMLNFTYALPNDDLITPTDEFIKNLAFMYNFHRYNLMRGALSKDDSYLFASCIDLRNLIIHTTNDSVLASNYIVETQACMRDFLKTEVIELKQKHIPFYGEAKLHTENQYDKNMQSTPLWKIYNIQGVELSEQIISNNQLSKYQFLEKLCFVIIPFINYLYNHFNASDISVEKKDEYRAALLFFSILCGEFVTLRWINYFDTKDKVELEDHFVVLGDQLVPFLNQFRQLRNLCSHQISERNLNEYVHCLATCSQLINPSCKPLDNISSIYSFTQSEVEKETVEKEKEREEEIGEKEEKRQKEKEKEKEQEESHHVSLSIFPRSPLNTNAKPYIPKKKLNDSTFRNN